MFNLLQRRLFLEMVKVFLLTMLVIWFLLMMSRVVQMRSLFFGLDMALGDTVPLLLYLSPYFLQKLMPIAVMLGVFLTFLRLSTDRELIALKAGGISLYQLLPGPLVFCGLSTLLALWLSLYAGAWGMENFRNLVLDIAGKRAKIALQSGVFNKEIPNMVFFARNVDPANGTLADVIVRDEKQIEGGITILAPEGRITTDYDAGEVLILLKDGSMYSQGEQNLSVLGFAEYAVRLSISQLVQGIDLGPLKPNEMFWAELNQMAKLTKNEEADKTLQGALDTEIQMRWVFPLACMVLGIIAIPLGTAFQGAQQQGGLIIALILFLLYYAIITVCSSLGEANRLPSVLVLWIPNLVFLLFGLVAIRLAAMERFPNLADIPRTLRQRWRKILPQVAA